MVSTKSLHNALIWRNLKSSFLLKKRWNMANHRYPTHQIANREVASKYIIPIHSVEPFILHTIKPQTGWMMFPFFCGQTVEPLFQRYTIVFGGLWPSPSVCFWKPRYKYILVFNHFTIYIEVNTTNTAANTSNVEENVQNMFLTSTKAN